MDSVSLEYVDAIAQALRDDEVHVWQLSAYRREQGRAPLLALLRSYLASPGSDVSLIDDEHGRPRLAAPLNLTVGFNWSHSGSTALVAIARNMAPGIDVEQRRPRPRAIALAQRYFDAAETAALEKLQGQELERAFLQLWTGKEAVLKALGRGLAFGLHRLRVSVLPTEPQLLWLDGDDVSAWQLHTLSLGDSLIGSLAWRGSPRDIHVRTLAEGG